MKQETQCKHPGVVALSALLTIFATTAMPQPIGLLFVLDGSSALSPAQFIEQKTVFANVFGKVPVDSSIAIGVWQFSNEAKQEFAFRTIDSPGARQRLIEATSGMHHLNGKSAIGDGIQAALDAVTEYGIGNLEYVDIVVTTAGPYDAGIDPNIAADAAVSAGIAAIYCYRDLGTDCNFMRSGYAIGGDTVFSLIPANVVQMFPIHGKLDSRQSVPPLSNTSDDGWSKQTMRLDNGKDSWFYRGEVRRDAGKRGECGHIDCPYCNYGYCAHGVKRVSTGPPRHRCDDLREVRRRSQSDRQHRSSGSH